MNLTFKFLRIVAHSGNVLKYLALFWAQKIFQISKFMHSYVPTVFTCKKPNTNKSSIKKLLQPLTTIILIKCSENLFWFEIRIRFSFRKEFIENVGKLIFCQSSFRIFLCKKSVLDFAIYCHNWPRRIRDFKEHSLILKQIVNLFLLKITERLLFLKQ